ncbi:MAG: YjjG family noncanonical pyrimidine nucleotidase [Lachnospiraceae bacterium]
MKSYRFLMFDADETLFDFKYAEREALKTALLQNGIEYKEEYHSVYTKLNQSMWKQLELGRITKEELLATRFRRFFESIGLTGDTEKMRVNFQANLSAQSRLLPGARKLCRDLSGQFELYLVTNGVAATQTARLAPSGLLPYFKGVFISEQVGAPKPSKEFFDAVEQGIPGFVKEQAIVIGDSLTSDIRGGNNAGIDTCWYNPHGVANDTDAVPTYTVADYAELRQLLMQM